MSMTEKNRVSVRTGGFTLVELMIVVTIISILVGLVISFGSRFQQMARADRTRMAMKIAMSAADYYYEVTNIWPASGGSNFAQMQTIIDPATGVAPAPVTPTNFIYSDRLVRDMGNIKGSRERLKNMPAGTLKQANVPRDLYDDSTDAWYTLATPSGHWGNATKQRSLMAPTILDGWDRPMLYQSNQSQQGKPILISAGPDGRFAPTYYYYKQWGGAISWNTSRETDSTFGLDDITSDQGM
ncbi:MAG: type II secretion system protein [Planctomycetes bacterium]|nr:type II secretion system protein [Planctomycetota bacterium]